MSASSDAKLDEEYRRLSRSLAHLGIELELEAEDRLYDEAFMHAAEAFIAQLPQLLFDAGKILVRDNLGSANDWRHDADEPVLNEAELLNLVKLRRIHWMSSGHYTLWYDDGDVFCGHEIYVTGSNRGLDCSGMS